MEDLCSPADCGAAAVSLASLTGAPVHVPRLPLLTGASSALEA